MDIRTARLDVEFHQQLAEMKPYVLKLPHKTERQRCALWIKKLCEPPSTTSDQKNRELYAKLLLHMLKRGLLDGPFAVRPEDGPLKELPSYMSIFFNDSTYGGEHTETLSSPRSRGVPLDPPDWVVTELGNSGYSSVAFKENVDPISEFRTSSPLLNFSRSDGQLNDGRHISEYPASRPDHVSRAPSTFRDEQSLIRMHEKELEMKSKVLQAQFHEEKLKMQHKHDKAVQKILDRKNSEIEEIKQHFTAKERDFEEAVTKSDRRTQGLIKELQILKEVKEREVDELKAMVDETAQAAKAEYDAKVEEVHGAFERDKYEMHKAHTKKIQELLDDTNQRLLKMEEEYGAQMTATKLIISELEGRVTQLTQEAETLSLTKQSLLNDKDHTEKMLEDAEEKLKKIENKYSKLEKEFKLEKENHELQLKSLLSKHDANTEFLKQENNLSTNKAQEVARDLEDQLQNLKHALRDAEQQRVREIRERESLHQQDIMSLQHLHEKQMHQLRSEWDQDKAHHARELRSMEEIVNERDGQITKITIQQKQSAEQAEQAIEDYKKHATEAQKKVFDEMQAQLEKMACEVQQKSKSEARMELDFKSQLDEQRMKHQEELTETVQKFNQEKALLAKQAGSEREELLKLQEKQLMDLEQRMDISLQDRQRSLDDSEKQHREVVTSMEAQIRELREELVSANALRRQQLVELGLLREEERQKAAREHDSIVNRLEAEIDRQRLTMHQQNAADLDKQAVKAKTRLEGLERDYKQRLERAYDRISELQQKESALRDELARVVLENEQQMADNAMRRDEDSKKLRLQLESVNVGLKAELEAEKEKLHSLSRLSQKNEFDLKDKLTCVKMEYEEKMKGLLPASLRTDMEDTIGLLRSQVSSLQQRVTILQDELNENQRLFPLSLDTPTSL